VANETRVTKQFAESLSSTTDATRVTKQVVEAPLMTTGNVRMTKQYAEAATSVTDPIRITKQWIEVLIPYEPPDQYALISMGLPVLLGPWRAVSYRN